MCWILPQRESSSIKVTRVLEEETWKEGKPEVRVELLLKYIFFCSDFIKEGTGGPGRAPPYAGAAVSVETDVAFVNGKQVGRVKR